MQDNEKQQMLDIQTINLDGWKRHGVYKFRTAEKWFLGLDLATPYRHNTQRLLEAPNTNREVLEYRDNEKDSKCWTFQTTSLNGWK